MEVSGVEARGWVVRFFGVLEDMRMIGEVGGFKVVSFLFFVAGVF